MKDRREFIKTGVALLGSSTMADKLGLAGAMAQTGNAGRPRVVVARDAQVRAGGQWDEQRVLALVDRAVMTYFGRTKPMDAWKNIGFPHAAKGGVIGIKVNGLGGKGISTHAVVTKAICERLQQAGVSAGNIVVWDRTARDLAACGMTINATDRSKVRCFGSDVAGYESAPESWGVAKIRLSKILSQECVTMINVPVLKDHELAGVTFAMKNMYGVIDRPDTLHAGNCNPGVADLNCIPAIKAKMCITIGDALASVYQGGPGFRPEFLWYPNAIVVGEDRVAVDRIAWQMIETKRAAMGLPTLEAAGRPATYIDTAADAKHKLGVSDPKRIKLIEV